MERSWKGLSLVVQMIEKRRYQLKSEKGEREDAH